MQTQIIDKDDIIDAYKDLVYRLAFTYVKNKYDADDVFQDVFLIYFKKDRIFESQEHQTAWIIRVTINRCKRHFINARKTISLDSLDHDFPAKEKEDYNYIYQTILNLKPKQRLVFSLFYIEELSIKEINQSTGISESNIKTLLHRARKEMKERINKEYEWKIY